MNLSDIHLKLEEALAKARDTYYLRKAYEDLCQDIQELSDKVKDAAPKWGIFMLKGRHDGEDLLIEGDFFNPQEAQQAFSEREIVGSQQLNYTIKKY